MNQTGEASGKIGPAFIFFRWAMESLKKTKASMDKGLNKLKSLGVE